VGPYLFFAFHVHRSDREEPVLCAGKKDLGPPISSTVELEVGQPAFFQTLPCKVAKILVYWSTWAIVAVQECL
jgi:hypothetical protein